MDPLSTIESAISSISAIKAQAESISSNIKTCKLLAQRCQDLIPSLKRMKSNTNRATSDDSLQTLTKLIQNCESFIISHGKKASMSQFFNVNIIRDEFDLLTERLNASIMCSNMDIQLDKELQRQEAFDALVSDMVELKAAVIEIANKHNIKLDQIGDNSVGHNEIVIKYIQSVLDEASSPLSAISDPHSSLGVGGPETAVPEAVKVPACPVCLSEYSDSQKCYLICSNGHSLCAVCKGPSTRGGKCPVCRGPCLPGGGFVNRAVMDVVDAITLLSTKNVSNPLLDHLSSSFTDLPSVPTHPCPPVVPPAPHIRFSQGGLQVC